MNTKKMKSNNLNLKNVAFLLVCIFFAGCQRTQNEQPQAEFTPPLPVEYVENPQYAEWANFSIGTQITVKSTTTTDGNDKSTCTTTVFKLKEINQDNIVLSSTVHMKRYDGFETNDPENKMVVARRVAKQKESKNTASEKNVLKKQTKTIFGKEVECLFTESTEKSESGELLTDICWSKSVPGNLIKSTIKIPSKKVTTVTELVDWK